MWAAWKDGFASRAANQPQYSEPMPGFHNVAMMLRGMACECLLKARGLELGKFKLAKDGELLKGKKKENSEAKSLGLWNHNLVKLATTAGFDLQDQEEERALAGLRHAIMAGRFPEVGDWTTRGKQAVEGPPLLQALGYEEETACDRLLERLLGEPLP